MNFRRISLLIIISIAYGSTGLSQTSRKQKPTAPPLALVKKDKSAYPKINNIEFLGPVEPDHLPSRSKPDHFVKPLKIPRVFSFPDDNCLHGYDMSHYQGDVQWSVVASDPLAGFIYLKATEGVKLIDSKYTYNISECRRVGLKVGSYHFFRAQFTAEEQFNNFMSVVETNKQDLIPLVDVEILPRNVSHTIFINRLRVFCELIEKNFGCKPMIYTGRNFYDKHLARTDINCSNYKFMIAAYMDDEPVLTNDDDYLIWQFTSTGHAEGVRGKVDISRFRGSHSLNEILY